MPSTSRRKRLTREKGARRPSNPRANRNKSSGSVKSDETSQSTLGSVVPSPGTADLPAIPLEAGQGSATTFDGASTSVDFSCDPCPNNNKTTDPVPASPIEAVQDSATTFDGASTSAEVSCNPCPNISKTTDNVPASPIEAVQDSATTFDGASTSAEVSCNPCPNISKTTDNVPAAPIECSPSHEVPPEVYTPPPNLVDLLLELKTKVDALLPQRWLSLVDGKVLHVLYYSIQKCVIVQRSIVVSPEGSFELFVHNEAVDIGPFIQDEKLDPLQPLNKDTVNSVADTIASIVSVVRKLEVCSGYDDVKFQVAWDTCRAGVIDRNPFHECRFVETFRSPKCLRLVTRRKWRCTHCTKLYFPLRRLAAAAAEKERHANTNNIHLTQAQLLDKLAKQRIELNNAKNTIYRLRARMDELIQQNGVLVNEALSSDLEEILSNQKLTPAQSIFLQQQVKASQVKNACGMRWHPTMIRFALSIHLTSPAAYEMMRQTGMIKLPSSSTLFDYSHVKPAEEGIDKAAIETLASKIVKFPEKHKKYHTLMADEMYISQNLVFQKSSGKMVGYTSLDDIDREIKTLDQLIDDPAKEVEETMASKILVYMVKGVTNGLKSVVACFATRDLTASQLYVWTWKVIGALERSGVAVIAFVSDGSSVNRSFIKKNKPATIHVSGITFDTWNKAAPGRKLYFIADVPHLLKTIRNCLLNSRWDGKKSRRKMMKNGKKITWDFIIKLYEDKKHKSLRKSFKLNAMNVYPDSYARMKVKYAGQPLSNTVCQDMRSQEWPEASETENFIEAVNNWFDCLNGAHSSQGVKTRNPYLAPYTNDNYQDRFDLLDNFLKYLDEWEIEANNLNVTVNTTLDRTTAGPELDESEIEDGCLDPADNTPASKRLLSKPTIEGIKITTLAFQPLVLFMLSEGASFINARIFCQDPLEQHFSKIRAGQGGSNNPNASQFLNRNNALHLVGELGMRKRKGNSGEMGSHVEVTTAKMPKLQWNRVPKFCDGDES